MQRDVERIYPPRYSLPAHLFFSVTLIHFRKTKIIHALKLEILIDFLPGKVVLYATTDLCPVTDFECCLETIDELYRSPIANDITMLWFFGFKVNEKISDHATMAIRVSPFPSNVIQVRK